MIRKLTYILCSLLLMACQNSTEPTVGKKRGALLLRSVELFAQSHTAPLTRITTEEAETLLFEIYTADGTKVEAEIIPGISTDLEAGNYILKVFSARYDQSYEGLGWKNYYYEQPFTVEEDKVTSIHARVNMTNVGISFQLPEADWIKACQLTVTVGERTLSIQQGETAYFDLPQAEELLHYTLTLTNTDEEEQTQSNTYSTPLQVGMYTIDYQPNLR